MGGHGQQLPDLLALHRKGKADIFRGQQPEARQRLGHVFFLMGQLVIDDALQPQQVILCGYNLEKQAVFPQNPVKFLGERQSKQAGEHPGAAGFHRDMGRRGAEPLGGFVPPRRPADGLLGDIQTCQGQVESLRQAAAIVPFAAAHVQNFPGGTVFPCRCDQSFGDGGIEPAV